MKVIAFSRFVAAVVVMAASALAQAGYDCRTQDLKTSIEILYYWRTGFSATVTSQEITEFYRREGLNVDQLTTAEDPETRRPVSEEEGNTYSFLLGAPTSGTDTAWGLTLEFTTGDRKRAKAVVSDMTGQSFVYDLNCERTGDLE